MSARSDFLVAADSALDVLGRVGVAQRWAEPSALAQMTVGALGAHLASQVLSVHTAVTTGQGATQDRPVPLVEHYARVAWLGADVDEDANVTIRTTAAKSAEIGHDALFTRVERAIGDLRTAFSTDLPMGLPPAITMPWWDWSLSFEDFLLTRVMEIVVHSDDLVVSVDTEPLTLPESVLGPVLALLVGISLRRHGQPALIRALSRSERAGGISAF